MKRLLQIKYQENVICYFNIYLGIKCFLETCEPETNKNLKYYLFYVLQEYEIECPDILKSFKFFSSYFNTIYQDVVDLELINNLCKNKNLF